MQFTQAFLTECMRSRPVGAEVLPHLQQPVMSLYRGTQFLEVRDSTSITDVSLNIVWLYVHVLWYSSNFQCKYAHRKPPSRCCPVYKQNQMK